MNGMGLEEINVRSSGMTTMLEICLHLINEDDMVSVAEVVRKRVLLRGLGKKDGCK
jgi:hypothetical protein